ncbi:hypothetical protein CEXT_413851 [Caerostris extrusa]|uniref:Uncharacterized protein n=1 Tax=Caerostris extrusa TaxID=172846 RepID=A0AAV4TKC7_CAEEX|nr:hypothetical protein CEXT_413851 [Caerostris extrusa]
MDCKLSHWVILRELYMKPDKFASNSSSQRSIDYSVIVKSKHSQVLPTQIPALIRLYSTETLGSDWTAERDAV